MAENDIILEMKDISKSFPGVKALDHVSIKVRRGTVHALMGENGAGKSTPMKCAFGLYDPDEGEVYLDGEKVSFKTQKEGLEHGISMIPQELNPIRFRNVAENIFCGRYPEKKVMGITFVDDKKMFEETKALYKELNMDLEPTAIPNDLSASMIQLNEVAKAISYDAKVIIMDEPTSSLTAKETDDLFETIHHLTARGIAIIYISHKIDEILRISDDVTIMRDGQNVGSWPASELTEELIVNRMVGREMTAWFPEIDNNPSDEIALEVKGFSSPNPRSFQDCSFTLRKGELLGVAGLVGAQRTELMEAIFGMREHSAGELYKDGKKIENKDTRDAIRNGFGLLTEDRRRNGIFGGLSVRDNTVIANLDEYCNGASFLNLKQIDADTKKYVDAMEVKTPTYDTLIRDLSGGNQQKVLIGRWLLTNPDILIMDEPTRGIDVGAKAEIYNIMLDLTKQGKSVIFISSEMPEIIGVSNRVMVMCEGRISGFLEGDEIKDNIIMDYASRVGGSGIKA